MQAIVAFVPQVVAMNAGEGDSQEKPLMVISGGDDQMRPSSLYAEEIFQRMRDHNRVGQHLLYPKAGHGIAAPYFPLEGPLYYHPVGKKWFTLGGSRVEDAKASADAWQKTLKFFHKNLNCRDNLN